MNESAPEIRGATTGQDEGCARKQLIKCCHDWKTQNCYSLKCCHNWKTENCNYLKCCHDWKNSELSFFERLPRLKKLKLSLVEMLPRRAYECDSGCWRTSFKRILREQLRQIEKYKLQSKSICDWGLLVSCPTRWKRNIAQQCAWGLVASTLWKQGRISRETLLIWQNLTGTFTILRCWESWMNSCVLLDIFFFILRLSLSKSSASKCALFLLAMLGKVMLWDLSI